MKLEMERIVWKMVVHWCMNIIGFSRELFVTTHILTVLVKCEPEIGHASTFGLRLSRFHMDKSGIYSINEWPPWWAYRVVDQLLIMCDHVNSRETIVLEM